MRTSESKKGSINIENAIFYYINNPNINKYAFFKTKSFHVKIDDLKIIGLYRTLSLDDELDMLIFIDHNGNKSYIPIFYDLETPSLLILKEKFELNLDLIQKSDIEDYTNKRAIILYPKELEGSSLYKKSSILIRILKLLRIKPIADRNLTNSVKSIIESINT
ncbi:hypothetical protein [Kordia sp.]|uniref:hypothetical protein n=1 Tax=Kordia sp. TaxID=1965332 RepID=UPI003B5C1C68